MRYKKSGENVLYGLDTENVVQGAVKLMARPLKHHIPRCVVLSGNMFSKLAHPPVLVINEHEQTLDFKPAEVPDAYQAIIQGEEVLRANDEIVLRVTLETASRFTVTVVGEYVTEE